MSPGFPSGGGKGQCMSMPRLHKGEFGPVTPFALRAGAPPKRKEHKKWDDRHNVMYKNDLMAPNMRNYFDRPLDRVDSNQIPCPRPRLRPYWTLDVPRDPTKEGEVYRIFDAREGQWKEQWQWSPLADLEAELLEKPVASEDYLEERAAPARPAAQPAGPPTRPRTPRRTEDLRKQRNVEKEWNKRHGTVFSRFNHLNHQNYRSYFDRWKDDGGGLNNNEINWRLGVEKKPMGGMTRSMSEPDPYKDRGGLPGQGAWVGNF